MTLTDIKKTIFNDIEWGNYKLESKSKYFLQLVDQAGLLFMYMQDEYILEGLPVDGFS